MPTILYLFGLRFFFYSEEHLPIHVHVESGSGKAKVRVDDGAVLENQGMKPSEMKTALRAIAQYKQEIIDAWNEYFEE